MLHRLTIIATAALLAATPLTADAQGRAATVVVAPVEAMPIADTTPVIGQLVASVEADVAARRAGIASEVLFDIGDRVEKGRLLVRLDTQQTEIQKRMAAAALETARAGVASSEASLTMAEQGLSRQQRLQGSTAFSRAQFEDLGQMAERARGELARAQAEVLAAEASIAMVDYDLQNAEIRAPFAGVVVERIAQPGQYVRLGDPIARLLDAERLEIEADAPSNLIPGLPQGRSVEVMIEGALAGRAVVRTALPVETIATRTRPVRFEADLSAIDPARVAVGKSVTLLVPISAPRDALMVPKDALVQGRGGAWTVFVVDEDVAQPRTVKLGEAAGDRMEVLEGLDVGDSVVVRGNERLRPGQSVSTRAVGG